MSSPMWGNHSWKGTELDKYIQQAVHDMMAKQDEALEKMVVEMLLDGERGIKVTEYQDSLTIELSNEVPFGEIHWHRDYPSASDFSLEGL